MCFSRVDRNVPFQTCVLPKGLWYIWWFDYCAVHSDPMVLGQEAKDSSGAAKTTTDYQLISYIFFLVAAANACVILGNPFFALYFPEKLLESKDKLMPMAYSTGIKLSVYFTPGWLFAFLSQYTAGQDSKK
ncbi:MAG: hypothetical protein ACYTBJ_18080 [Planctomycetota bacterium]|jgi:hypothetical protein